MRGTLQLLIVVAEAALMVTAGCFVVVLIGFKPELTAAKGEIAGAMALFLPIGAAAWWMFRKLQAHYARREARAASIAFAVFAPVTLLMGLLLGQIFGGYTGALLGDRFSFLGALAGIVLFITLASFVPSALALWTTRRVKRG